MPFGTVELVMFAVQAGVKVGRAARQAYIEQTMTRSIGLPIPNVGFSLSVLQARTFFQEEGKSFLLEDSDLAALHASALAGTIGERGDETYDTYMKRYELLRSVWRARRKQELVETTDGGSVEPDALLALFRIEQWDRADPNRPKPMRRVLGAIVDVGVEYFATVPGALGAQTSQRKVLESFVRSIDQLDFEAIAIDEEPLARLMSGLLVSALETIGSQPDLVASDANVQELVRVTSTALGQDIAKAMEGADGFESDSIRAWGDLVFRSVLRSGGAHVLERPGVFLGVEGEPRQALVSRVGGAALRLVIDHENPKVLFSSEGLDALVSATLLVVADHPELVVDTDNEGIEALVSTLARDLGDMDRVVDLGLVPDIAQRVLIRTGEHLDLIWPDLDPRHHLLLTAAKVVLQEVSRDPPDGSSWSPRFGRDEILAVVDAVMDELVSNPAWLLAIADDADAMLGDVVRAIIDVLRSGADERLSTATAAEIVRVAMRAIARRQGFLSDLPNGEMVIAAAIDAVVWTVFQAEDGTEAAWQLLRDETIVLVIEVALDAVATFGLDEEIIGKIREVVEDLVEDLTSGGSFTLDSLKERIKDELEGVL